MIQSSYPDVMSQLRFLKIGSIEKHQKIILNGASSILTEIKKSRIKTVDSISNEWQSFS